MFNKIYSAVKYGARLDFRRCSAIILVAASTTSMASDTLNLWEGYTAPEVAQIKLGLQQCYQYYYGNGTTSRVKNQLYASQSTESKNLMKAKEKFPNWHTNYQQHYNVCDSIPMYKHEMQMSVREFSYRTEVYHSAVKGSQTRIDSLSEDREQFKLDIRSVKQSMRDMAPVKQSFTVQGKTRQGMVIALVNGHPIAIDDAFNEIKRAGFYAKQLVRVDERTLSRKTSNGFTQTINVYMIKKTNTDYKKSNEYLSFSSKLDALVEKEGKLNTELNAAHGAHAQIQW